MINITLRVSKLDVYNEVAQTTSYTGMKMKGDETAYVRIFTTDDDRSQLERFWTEACNAATDELKKFVVQVSNNASGGPIDLSRDYEVQLELSASYDEHLTESINASLYSFFVAAIVSKWFRLANKGEAEAYATDALRMMNDVMRKIYFRKKPTRVIPS